MVRRILFFGLLLVLVAFSGCVKKEAASEKGSEFLVWIPGDRGEYGFYYDMFDNFKAYKEAKGESFSFVIEQQPWGDYWTKLPLEINNGRGPDLFLAHTAYIDTLKPIAKELDFSKETLNQFYLTDLFLGPSGKPYFIPTLFVSKIMYGNKDLWPDYENYPKSWDELSETAKKLSDKAKGIIGFDYSWHVMVDIAYQNGNTITKADGQLDFDGIRTALGYIKQWEESGISDYLSYGNGSSENSFYEGSSAIIYGEPWMEFWAPNEINSYAFPLPGQWAQSTAELSFGISKNVDDKQFKVLNEFVAFMLTDEETNKAIVKGNSAFPNNKNITVSYEPGTAGDAVTKTFQSEKNLFVLIPASLERVYRTMVGNFITSKDADAVLDEAEKSLKDVDLSLLIQTENAFRKKVKGQ